MIDKDVLFLIDKCMDYQHLLTDWENAFIDKICGFSSLSEKQYEKLLQILRKLPND